MTTPVAAIGNVQIHEIAQANVTKAATGQSVFAVVAGRRAPVRVARWAGRMPFHNRQLGARVAWRDPRVGRSEVRERRIGKGSVNGAPRAPHAGHRRVLAVGRLEEASGPLPIQTRHTVGSTVGKPPNGSATPTVRLYAKARRSFPNTQRRAFCVSRLPNEAIWAESRRAERGRRTRSGGVAGPALRLFPQSQRRSARSAPRCHPPVGPADEDSAPRPPRPRRWPRDSHARFGLTTTNTRRPLSSPTVLIGM